MRVFALALVTCSSILQGLPDSFAEERFSRSFKNTKVVYEISKEKSAEEKAKIESYVDLYLDALARVPENLPLPKEIRLEWEVGILSARVEPMGRSALVSMDPEGRYATQEKIKNLSPSLMRVVSAHETGHVVFEEYMRRNMKEYKSRKKVEERFDRRIKRIIKKEEKLQSACEMKAPPHEGSSSELEKLRSQWDQVEERFESQLESRALPYVCSLGMQEFFSDALAVFVEKDPQAQSKISYSIYEGVDKNLFQHRDFSASGEADPNVASHWEGHYAWFSPNRVALWKSRARLKCPTQDLSDRILLESALRASKTVLRESLKNGTCEKLDENADGAITDPAKRNSLIHEMSRKLEKETRFEIEKEAKKSKCEWTKA